MYVFTFQYLFYFNLYHPEIKNNYTQGNINYYNKYKIVLQYYRTEKMTIVWAFLLHGTRNVFQRTLVYTVADLIHNSTFKVLSGQL